MQSTFTHPLSTARLRKKAKDRRSEEKNFRVELGKMDTLKGSRSNPDADDKKKKNAAVCFCVWGVYLLFALGVCSLWFNVCHIVCTGSEPEHLLHRAQKAARRNIPCVSALSFQEHQPFKSTSLHQLPNAFSFFFSFLTPPHCWAATVSLQWREGREIQLWYFFFIISPFLPASKLLPRQS